LCKYIGKIQNTEQMTKLVIVSTFKEKNLVDNLYKFILN